MARGVTAVSSPRKVREVRLTCGAIGQLEAVSDRMESCALIGNLTRFLLHETHLAPQVGLRLSPRRGERKK